MRKYNVVEVIRTFSKEELSGFRRFLLSPYFVSHKKLKPLFELLAEEYLGKEEKKLDKKLDKKQIYQRLFEEEYNAKGYCDATLRNEMYMLLNAAERFLTIQNFEKDEVHKEEFLRKELLTRELEFLYRKNLLKSGKGLDGAAHLDPTYYLMKFNLEQEIINLNSSTSDFLVKKNIKPGTYHINSAARQLTSFFIAELYSLNDKYSKYIKRNEESAEKDFLLKLNEKINLQELLKFLKSESKIEDEVIFFEIYASLSRAFKHSKNMAYYYKFKSLLTGNAELLGVNQRQYLFSRLVDYCVLKHKSEKRNKKYSGELLSIYKLMVEKRYYAHTDYNYIPLDLFRNILIAGIREEEFEWTSEFIENHREFLKPAIRDDAYHYCKARLLFEQNRFDDALEMLNQISKEYYIFQLDIRLLYLKTFYETGSVERGLYFIESFKRHISNNRKIPTPEKQSYRNFLRMVHKMLKEKSKAKAKVKTKASDLLAFEINREEKLVQKKWLLQKAAELAS